VKQKVLVVGIGNPVRQDDGIGPYCVKILQQTLDGAKRKLVDCMTVHQLDVIHCDTFSEYPFIIFIDADALNGPEAFRLEVIHPEPGPQPFTSHIGSIPEILSLTGSIFGVFPKAYLVAVRGMSFEVGEDLTPVAVKNANEALEIVNRLIDELFPLG